MLRNINFESIFLQVDELSNVVIKNSDNMDSLSLRNVSINDDGIEKIKEAVKNAENLKVNLLRH